MGRKEYVTHIALTDEEYVKQLMKIIYVILEPKYVSKIPYRTDEEMYYVDREYDKSRVSNLLDSIPIRDKYEAKETLYYNLLSVIMVVERTKRAANNFNYSYEPYNGRVNNKKLSKHDTFYAHFMQKAINLSLFFGRFGICLYLCGANEYKLKQSI